MWLALAALSSSLVPLAHEQRDHAQRCSDTCCHEPAVRAARTGLRRHEIVAEQRVALRVGLVVRQLVAVQHLTLVREVVFV